MKTFERTICYIGLILFSISLALILGAIAYLLANPEALTRLP